MLSVASGIRADLIIRVGKRRSAETNMIISAKYADYLMNTCTVVLLNCG